MTTWNYRVTQQTRHDHAGVGWIEYAVREVYYDEGSNVVSWSEDPCVLAAETVGDLQANIRRMHAELEKGWPILDLDAWVPPDV